MRIGSSYIRLDRVRLYAYHGVSPQEGRVGADFEVTLRVGYPVAKAMETDDVADTLSYAELLQTVCREMAVPSRLLEHVAGRMVQAIGREYPQVTTVDLWLTKVNPPMGVHSDGAGVELHVSFDSPPTS